MWVWVAVGLGSFLVVSSFFGLMFARVMSAFRQASESLETEVWAHIAPGEHSALNPPG